jgi:hypothetical protein
MRRGSGRGEADDGERNPKSALVGSVGHRKFAPPSWICSQIGPRQAATEKCAEDKKTKQEERDREHDLRGRDMDIRSEEALARTEEVKSRRE